jgi:hypothetical protein
MTNTPLPDLFSYRDARAAGVSRRRLDRMIDSGEVSRLRRGWYALSPGAPSPAQEEWDRITAAHLWQLRAHLSRFPGHAASHTSAALVHGLAVTVGPDSPVELTVVDGCPRSRREQQVVLHHADSVSTPNRVVHGIRVTTLERTLVDLLRTRRLPHGVAALDAALRAGATGRPAVQRLLDRQLRWRGRPRALGALAISDPRRETWLESYSFTVLLEHGIPLPLAQVDVHDEQGRFVARVDGLDPETGVFFEADGLGKYFLDAVGDGPGYAAAVRRVIEAEWDRQGRLEGLGLTGVRWMGHEIRADPELVVRRVRVATTSADPHAFTGSIVHDGVRHRLPWAPVRPTLDLEQLRTRRRRPRGVR